MNEELRAALVEGGNQYGLDPLHVATAMSYETGGTFDPWKKGPTTQHGEHRGLIQWGGPQRQQYGVTKDTSVRDQVMAAYKYLSDRGVKSGDGLLQIYAAINAGNAKNINASDANNGGAPGTVLDKVQNQMAGHERNARLLMGSSFKPIGRSIDNPISADVSTSEAELPLWQTATPRAAEVQSDDPSLWQLQADAWNTQQTLPWLYDAMTRDRAAADPNWSNTPERLKQDLTDRGIPLSEIERYSSRLESASEADYLDNLGRVKDDWDRTSRLQQAGMTGAFLQIANQILDPVALGADIAASSVAPQLVLGNRFRRVSSVLSSAVAGAAGGFASEAVAASVNPNRDQMDMLYGTVFGFGVGGVVGRLLAQPSTTFEAVQLSRAGNNAVTSYETPMGSVGAAKASPQQPFLSEEGLGLLDDRDFAETFGGALRPDLSARLQQSKNTVTKAGAGLVQDGTGKKDGSLNAIAASEDMERLFGEMATTEARTYNVQLKEFAKEAKGSADQIERDFNRQIDGYIRDQRPGRGERYHAAAIRAANRQTELYSEALKLQQNPFYREGIEGRSVMGTDGIPTDQHFAPRYWESQRLILASKEYVDGAIEDLIGRSMKSANPALEDGVIERTAKAFTRAIVNRAHGLEDIASHSLSSDKLDVLIELLQDQYNLTKGDADALRATFRGSSDDAGRDAHNKHRLLLDETFRMDNVARRDGTIDEAGIGISDLISTDARQNFSRYMRSTMGRVALARYRFKDPKTGEMLINGFTSDGEFEKYISLVKKKNADLIKEGKIKPSDGDTDIKRLRFAYSSILGRPTSELEATNTGWFLRMARKYNFARIMNQVGFAQVSEIGTPIASLGWKAALSQAPALRRVITDDGETILKSGLADDLETIWGVGTDRLRATADYRMDDLTGFHEEPTGTWRDHAEGFLNKAGRVTSEVSGLTQANIMLERWTAAMIVQKFANMSVKGGKGMSKARLADLGLDEAMTARVMKMFTTDGNFEFAKGAITGKKVVRAHFDNWSDKEAREAFIQAGHRLARQIIQKNDIGNMVMWMSNPIAKAFMQFRTFMVGAYSKQTLKSLNFRDGVALNNLILTTGFAGASYYAQMKIQAIGREDADEFLEDRLSPKNLASAAFSRAAVSSIVPMLIDTALPAFGQDQLFTKTRTTGQATDAWLGNPTTGGVNDVLRMIRAVSGSFEDREWSQEEARNLVRPWLFGNSLPIVMGLNHAISDLPERAPR